MYVRTKQWQRGCQDASGKQTYDQREGVIVAGMGILGPSADLPETFLRSTVGASSTVCAGERKVNDLALALAYSLLLGVIRNVSLPSDQGWIHLGFG